nr:uncharacterized protein LOC123762114 [Procambarus clarkii]
MKFTKKISKRIFVIVVVTLATFGFMIGATITMQPVPRSPEGDGGVCTDIFEIGERAENMSSMMELAVRVIRKKRKMKMFAPFTFYEIVSYEMPSMVREVADGSGLNHSNVTLTQTWRLQQTKGQLPHLACRLRELRDEDIRICVQRRRETVGSTHIAYVGDSRVRQHVEVLLDHIRHLQPKITTHLGEVITVEKFLGEEGLKNWKKYKHDFRIECTRAFGLIVDFHWAALIDKGEKPPSGEEATKIGALDLLHRWLEAPSDQIPDLIILNTGAWQLMQHKPTVLQQIDEAAISVMTTLRPLLHHLASRSTVVWALPDPFKEYVSHDFSGKGHFTQQTNDILEWLLNAQIDLQAPGVIIWDSFLPVAYASRSDCIKLYAENVDLNYLPKFSVFPGQLSWHCSERMHVGFEALSVAVQMVLNHICNPHLGGNYCCSNSYQSSTM